MAEAVPGASGNAAERLCERSRDVQAAVLVDAAGALLESSERDPARARRLAELVRRLVEQGDAASSEPIAQIEVQVAGGAAFAVRTPRHVLACVARRSALPALVLYDLGRALGEVEAG